MKLINIDIKTFKKDIYINYKKMFPRLERKSYNHLKKCSELGMSDFIEIVENDDIIGYMILNKIRDIEYVQLDYFAILPKYQNKGYGTKALELLRKKYNDFNGIFIEVEKVGLGKNEIENNQRSRRDKFYRNIGFITLNYDFTLYKVIYTPYILFTKNEREDEKEIVNKMFKLYYTTVCMNNLKKFNKYCSYKKCLK